MTRRPGRRLIISAWLLGSLLFVGYLMRADRVCRAFDGKPYLVKLPDNAVLQANWNLDITRWFSPRPVNNKFEEGVAYQGQFTSVSDQHGESLRVFFRSKDAIYEVAENRRSFLGSANQAVVNLFVSTSGLKNDVYTLGLSLRDAAGERFAWVDSSFEKVPGGPVGYIARPLALQPSGSREDLKFVVEKMQKKRGNWFMRGWLSLENGEMADYNAYVLVKDSAGVLKTFYAPLLTHLAGETEAGSGQVSYGGFRLKLRHGEFVNGPHLVKVAIESRRTGEVVESVQEEAITF